jgi:hypothetical protein
MGPWKPMPFSPISGGKIFLFQDKKHDAVEYTKCRSILWKNLLPVSSISNQTILL